MIAAAKAKSDWVITMSAFKNLGRILLLSPKRKEKRGRSSASISVNPDSMISASQVRLHSIFSYFDMNKDGKIEAEELQSCVRMLGGELTLDEAEGVVKSLDLDGDGMLGFDEFQQLMDGKRGEDERERELKDAFKMFETEESGGGGGGITASGLKRMLRRLGEVWSMEECRMMIREFDLDGNGVISFDEFVAMMR